MENKSATPIDMTYSLFSILLKLSVLPCSTTGISYFDTVGFVYRMNYWKSKRIMAEARANDGEH